VERDQDRLVDQIVSTVYDEGVGRIIVGLPRPLSGRTNSQMASVLAFTEQLKAAVDIPVLTWDERFTTTLAAQGRPRSVPRDAVAACYMLQNYLDSLQSTREGA
jgi:putative Holliday junction resolvase